MASKKKSDVEAPGGAPQVRARLKQLAKEQAHMDTGVKPDMMKRGQKPVALRTTNKKKGTK